jgi:arylsulfatase A-like enzyme
MIDVGRLAGRAADRLERRPLLFGQVRLLLRWSAIICLAGLAATVAAKLEWAADARRWSDLGPLRTAWLVAADAAVLLGALGLCALVERRWRWSVVATNPLAAVLSFLAAINALWIGGTGGQLAASVFTVGLGQGDQNLAVAVEAVGPLNIALFALLFVAVPLALGTAAGPLERGLRDRAVPHGAKAPLGPLALALGCAVLAVAMPRHQSPAVRSMGRNVHLNLAFGLARGALTPSSAESRSAWLPAVAEPEEEGRATREERDVIIVMLESANWARSSFGDPAAARTPNLEALARRGLLATSMRAVIPHSTKSLFAVHCGDYPDMQRAIVETADNYPSNCLPRVLGERGWASAFFQSANGGFEQRPRLVHRLGFEAFVPRELLHAERTTVINGDDFAMLEPALGWMGRQREAGRPFVATFFTSLQHVNYSYPARLKRKTECKLGKKACERLAYEEIYRGGTDAFVGELVGRLEREGYLDNAILVLSGDHGEGFGEHGLFSHDNVYFEEGLHVPFLVVAPGLVPPGTVNAEPRSLIDVYPTILELLDVGYDPGSMDGRSLLQPEAPDARRYFRCWYDGYCEGFVRGTGKLVRLPEEDTWFRFDLADDPGEERPFDEEEGLAAEIDDLAEWMELRAELVESPVWIDQRLYDVWDCSDAKGRCKLVPEAYARYARERFPHGPGDGLHGAYFADQRFEELALERRDPVIDFLWPDKESPAPGLPAREYAIRWTGCLRVEPGEAPRLAVGSEERIDAWISGRRVAGHGARRNFEWAFAGAPLAPGLHPLRVEFVQTKGDAQVVLGWLTREGQALPEVVPPARLVPPGAGCAVEVPDAR